MAFSIRQAASAKESGQDVAAKPGPPLFNDQRASTGVQLKQQELLRTAQVPAQLTVIPGTVAYVPSSGRAGTSKLAYICDGYDYGKQNEPADTATSTMPMRDEIASTYIKTHPNDPFAMHLVNGRLGGSGADTENLAWGPSELNRKHYNNWENDRQMEVQSRSGERVDVSVQATYHSNDTNTPAGYYLKRLDCTHEIDGDSKTVGIEIGEPVEDDEEWKPNKKKKRKYALPDTTKPSKKHSGIKKKNSSKEKKEKKKEDEKKKKRFYGR